MAEELLETVDRLQSRLLENPEPRKVTAEQADTDGFGLRHRASAEARRFVPGGRNEAAAATQPDSRNGFLNVAFTGRCRAPTFPTSQNL